ncbi:MAG: rhamnulokinase [Oscillospiraceae bacterium]|nr:rhamnulokinase [Oscillospiraceae bacterium]
MAKKILAFDFGASSGRAMLATFDGAKIVMEEIHRFSNDPVKLNGVFYWDILRLMHEIKQGITKATHAGGFDAIGIDTWGVDFGLLDKEGRLLENPIHYRDERTVEMIDAAAEVVPKSEIYSRTGIQFARLNTLFQLYSLRKQRPELLDQADTMLFIPDLMAYFLTGAKKAEYTIASTSQMINPETKEWDIELLEKLSIPTSILPEIVLPGTQYGLLSDEICEELGTKKVPVIAVATHDTASAVVSVPNTGNDFVYISCGTWSLFGTELEHPIVNDDAQKYNFTNEGGYGGKIRFLKNIMGLWLIQESRRQWIREGFEVSYADLEKEALAAEPFRCFIDVDDAAFETPGNLPKRVQEFCEKTGQYVPQTRGEIMRCIYQSLAMKYRYTFENLAQVTGKSYDAIHMVGGGTKDNLLCQMTADFCNIEVIAGPIEATATGNIAVQLISLGELADITAARQVVADSLNPIYYHSTGADCEKAYQEFLKYIGK